MQPAPVTMLQSTGACPAIVRSRTCNDQKLARQGGITMLGTSAAQLDGSFWAVR